MLPPLERHADRESKIVLALAVERCGLDNPAAPENIHGAITEEYRRPIHLKDSQLGTVTNSDIQTATHGR